MPKPSKGKSKTEVKPEPALEKRTRRTFSAAYKLRILTEADACKYGELGVLLRKEKLYSSQLREWRKEFAQRGEAGLSKTAPGPKPLKTAEEKRIEQLERQNAQLQKKLHIAEGCLDLQKKALSLLDQMSNGNDA